MIFSRSEVLMQNCLTCLNDLYPNKNKAQSSAIIGTSSVSSTGNKKSAPTLKTLLSMDPLTTFTPLQPHRGMHFTHLPGIRVIYVYNFFWNLDFPQGRPGLNSFPRKLRRLHKRLLISALRHTPSQAIHTRTTSQ